jgi:hypothetical protein
VEQRYGEWNNSSAPSALAFASRFSVIYLHYKMRLTAQARQDMKAFWAWLEEREQWFYDDLPMVKEVRWYYSLVGDVYVIENMASFENETGWGEYRAALASRKRNDDWEKQRVSQDDWWEFLETKMFVDPPVSIGFTR